MGTLQVAVARHRAHGGHQGFPGTRQVAEGTLPVAVALYRAHGGHQGFATLQPPRNEDHLAVGCIDEQRWAARSRGAKPEETGRTGRCRLESWELGRGSAVEGRARRFGMVGEALGEGRAGEAEPSPERLEHGEALQVALPLGTVVGPVHPAAPCAASACKHTPWPGPAPKTPFNHFKAHYIRGSLLFISTTVHESRYQCAKPYCSSTAFACMLTLNHYVRRVCK